MRANTDPSLARERTELAWHRTSMSFLVVTALAVRVLADDAAIAAVAIAIPGCTAAVVAWRHDHLAWSRAAIAMATVAMAAIAAAH